MATGKTKSQPDHFNTDLETMSRVFRRFGEVECKTIRSPLYERFSLAIADDPDMLRLAAGRIEGQPPPNILYAAVHYLLLEGADHGLRQYYPALTSSPRSPTEAAYEAFRDFCHQHEERIRKLLSTRTVQTNVVRRSTALLPAFALVSMLGGGQPLAQLEIGASAGLNLLWPRYHFDYGNGTTWGDPASPVQLSTDLRAGGALPDLTRAQHVVWSRGVDLQPVRLDDADAVRWLQALVWPENVLLGEQLAAAIDIARSQPPEIVKADAAEALPALLDEAPSDATLIVFGTHTLYQFPRESLLKVLKAMQAHSTRRPVYFVSMESSADAHSALTLTAYEGGQREEILLANCHPHGYWLEWLHKPITS